MISSHVIRLKASQYNRQIHCYCRKGDRIQRNITIGNTNIDVSTEYSAADAQGNTVVTCGLSFIVSEFSFALTGMPQCQYWCVTVCVGFVQPINQQL